jgi:predicted permease
MAWLKRFANIFQPGRVRDEIDEEFRHHIIARTADNVAAGMSPAEARADALRRFGSAGAALEESYDADSLVWVDTIVQDLRYGVRMLCRNLGFTAVAAFALALGIGVNTAVLTAYKTVVTRPLQARDPGEMMNLVLTRDSGRADYIFSYPDYEAYRDSVHSFRGLIATNREQMRLSAAGGIVSQRTSVAESGLGRLGLVPSGASNAEFASVMAISENYFQVLGVGALSGRTFDSIGVPELLASPSVLISENYWQKRFAGDPAVLGKTIQLNGAFLKVVGITPHNFAGTHVGVPDFWLPLSLETLVHADPNWLRNREQHQSYRMFGRLAPGVSIGQAQVETTLVANRLGALHDPKSEWAKPATALVFPGSPLPVPLRMNRPLTLTILFIVVATGMVLLVACADVGSLQLIRARSRQNELETRLALGASRLRVIRQLLTESALLGLLAGVLGFLCSWTMLKFGVNLAAEAFPAEVGTLIFNVTPNLEIFIYVLVMSLAAGILFGLAPAMESSRSALSAARGSTSPARSRRIQDFLVSAQVGLSLVLMITGSMLIRSSINSLKMEAGYDSKEVIDLDLQFPEGPKYSAPRKLVLVQELRTRLAALPGVAAITSARPPSDYGYLTAAASLDGEKSSAQSVPWIHYTYVQASYFQTHGIPVLLGRIFPSQAGRAERSIVLSESAAKQLWPDQNPIGRNIRLGATDEQIHNPSDLRADGLAYQVIGVARDTRGLELNGSDSRQLYLPLPEGRLQDYPILIRTRSDPTLIMRAIDSVISSVDPDLVATSSTLEEMLRRSPSFIISSVSAAVASTVGLLGLLLALTGIYGTVGYIVVLRTREVGIRMAIGAQKRDILGLILGESTRPVLPGLLVGMLLAIGVSYLLRGLLFGLGTVDGMSFVGVPLLFLAIALIAAYPPSRRAMRVDPMVALRYE